MIKILILMTFFGTMFAIYEFIISSPQNQPQGHDRLDLNDSEKMKKFLLNKETSQAFKKVNMEIKKLNGDTENKIPEKNQSLNPPDGNLDDDPNENNEKGNETNEASDNYTDDDTKKLQKEVDENIQLLNKRTEEGAPDEEKSEIKNEINSRINKMDEIKKEKEQDRLSN